MDLLPADKLLVNLLIVFLNWVATVTHGGLDLLPLDDG
jgi:hypothetical protein